MTFVRKNLGSLGEDLARRFLVKKRYRFIDKNVRTKIGEIDLLMQDKNDIVIVEVKTKTGVFFGSGAEMVGYSKQQKLILLAKELSGSFPKKQIRIDVVEIDVSTEPPLINHIINAVEE